MTLVQPTFVPALGKEVVSCHRIVQNDARADGEVLPEGPQTIPYCDAK